MRERRTPVGPSIAGRPVPERLDQIGKFSHPVDRFIPLVPNERQPSSGAQDAVDFRKRAGRVKPMKRLGYRDRIRESIRNGHDFGAPIENGEPRNGSAKDAAHSGGRLDRNDRGSGPDQAPRELAGTGR